MCLLNRYHHPDTMRGFAACPPGDGLQAWCVPRARRRVELNGHQGLSDGPSERPATCSFVTGKRIPTQHAQALRGIMKSPFPFRKSSQVLSYPCPELIDASRCRLPIGRSQTCVSYLLPNAQCRTRSTVKESEPILIPACLIRPTGPIHRDGSV